MAYYPQSEDEFRDEYGGGRFAADGRRYRDEEPRRPAQPNDFRDYNHGTHSPDSRYQAAGRGQYADQSLRRDEARNPAARPASDLNARRRQGAGGYGYGDVARGYGQGRAGFNGDEDRGYDQSGLRGGLGNSGGREDFADRRFDPDQNPFRGGYGGGDYDRGRRDEPLLGRIGMYSQNPTDPRGRRDEPPRNYGRGQQPDDQDDRRHGRGWSDLDNPRDPRPRR